MINEYLFIAIPLFFLIAAVIFRRWRTGVVLIFIWLLVEDVIRRLIPGQPGQIMLVKDILILLTYSSFLATMAIKDKKIWRPSFIISLLLFIGFVLIEVFNYNAPNLFFGAIGLRHYLWYLPLAFLGYHMFDDKEKLLKFCRILVYAAIPLFALIIFQYLFWDSNIVFLRSLSTGHQFHNFTLVESEKIPLLSSVFGSAHRYARFSMLLFFLGVGLLTIKKSKILIISTISAFLGIILSGSRSAFVLTIMGIVLFIISAVYVKNNKIFSLWRNSRVKASLLVSILALAGLMVFIISDLGIFQITAFYYAFQERIPSMMFKEFNRTFPEAKLFGNGAGTMSQGLDYIPGGLDWIRYQTQELRTDSWFENGVSKIIFELGFAGLIIFYFFWGYLFYRTKKEIKKLNISPLRNLAVAISTFSFLMLIWFSFLHHQTFGDATTLATLWFFIGVLFNLNKLATSTA